jgi:two-component system cell cycle response regulator DivK
MGEGDMAGKVVLLVEDHDDNREIYSIRLRHAGYGVFEARDGEEALDMVALHHPDLILLDISLPIIDGFTVARILKGIRDTASIPIVALTAHDRAADREEASRIGFENYLTKPVEPRVVLSCVQRLIGQPAETLTSGGAVLATIMHALLFICS